MSTYILYGYNQSGRQIGRPHWSKLCAVLGLIIAITVITGIMEHQDLCDKYGQVEACLYILLALLYHTLGGLGSDLLSVKAGLLVSLYIKNMKQTINFSQFCDSFSDTYKDNFSYEGKRALFDYLENYEEETSTEIELDPVALCVEYTEYDNLEAIQANYSNIKSLEDLEDNTPVIKVGDGEKIIILDF